MRLRTGGALLPQQLVEEAEQDPLPPEHARLAEAMLSRWVIGTPDAAAAQVRALADQFGVDEVMIHPVAGAVAGTAADSAPAREETLRLLADRLIVGP